MMKTSEIRKQFLNYFAQHGHKILPSSSLVPSNDPTLLFTNAGMVQFKDVFLGTAQFAHSRVATAQRCVRAGGKHNDLENVGYTARHHTFFEMLGNFSFGDYFKRDAIQLAWTFLTQVLRLSPQKLWITVYEDDDEAAAIWLNDIGIDPCRLTRCGADSNFWMMGDVGPCGPCTEIFYDHGSEVPGGPPGTPEADGDRYVEIWNLVFMQYSRDKFGVLTPLPKPSVDTGMGLERLAAVMQGVHSNYDIDSFKHIIRAAATALGVPAHGQPSLRVIADHIRSCAFLIADGVVPGNEGRQYVLRRIIRRAIRHAVKLGATEPFFCRLVQPLVDVMGEAYPELIAAQSSIEHVLRQEEDQFAKTLDQGLKMLAHVLPELKTAGVIPGELVFRLYDTYGFPSDLTADIAREQGLVLDQLGFDQAMEKQKQQSRASSHFSTEQLLKKDWLVDCSTVFTGYTDLQTQAAIMRLYDADGQPVNILKDQAGVVVLDCSPFYAEGGGQVGDRGALTIDDAVFHVSDTRHAGSARLHIGHLQGVMTVGQQVLATVDLPSRQATCLNHSATHLLNAALRHVLGTHVLQKGSLVESTRLRFDFSHHAPLTTAEITAIENLVNETIRANIAIKTDLTTLEQAQAQGALFLAGEKYSGEVRVLTMGAFSKELCGGTHATRTGDIGLCKIVAEYGVAAGVRRIEVLTGEAALRHIQQQSQQLLGLASQLNTKPEQLDEKLAYTLQQQRILAKELEKIQTQLSLAEAENYLRQARSVKGCSVLITQISVAHPHLLREVADHLKHQLGSAVILLAAIHGEKIALIAAVTHDLTIKIKANDLVNVVAAKVGGKGGGRADLAQAGGVYISQLAQALQDAHVWIEQRL